MTPIHSIKNQYRGVNAHLHSQWQQAGWNNFHNPYIGYITADLRKRLLPIGYTAHMESSIQVRRGDEYARYPQSDVTIYDLQPELYRPQMPPAAQSLSGLVVPLITVIEENPISEKPYQAVIILPRNSTTGQEGEPIAWLEVLSPSNKRRGDDRDTYLAKRADLLDAGIVFVEIDYLHETSPTIAAIPDYSRAAERSHPYRILVFDPRPEPREGWASFNEFDVDQPIPEVAIPLSGADVLRFDFGLPYQRLYQEMVYGLESVDYAQLPMNFDRYTPADQARIAARMVAVLRAARAGADLEAAPLPVEPLPLDAALAEIKSSA